METVKSIKNIYEIFNYDFFVELQKMLKETLQKTLTDISIAWKENDSIKNNRINGFLNETRNRIALFDQERETLDQILSASANEKNESYNKIFQRFYIGEFQNTPYFKIGTCIDIETFKNLPLINENEEFLSGDEIEFPKKQTEIYIQLWDNNEILVSNKKEKPKVITSINDPRISIFLIERNENKDIENIIVNNHPKSIEIKDKITNEQK